MRTRNLSYRL